jgi:hypothetical protein
MVTVISKKKSDANFFSMEMFQKLSSIDVATIVSVHIETKKIS